MINLGLNLLQMFVSVFKYVGVLVLMPTGNPLANLALKLQDLK